jgi:hypothetical protein
VTSFLFSSRHKSNRTGVAVRGAAGDEMAPTARVWGLLNRSPLIGELALEGPRFDMLCRVARGADKAFELAMLCFGRFFGLSG